MSGKFYVEGSAIETVSFRKIVSPSNSCMVWKIMTIYFMCSLCLCTYLVTTNTSIHNNKGTWLLHIFTFPVLSTFLGMLLKTINFQPPALCIRNKVSDLKQLERWTEFSHVIQEKMDLLIGCFGRCSEAVAAQFRLIADKQWAAPPSTW
jgi:hypothetical protein